MVLQASKNVLESAETSASIIASAYLFEYTEMSKAVSCGAPEHNHTTIFGYSTGKTEHLKIPDCKQCLYSCTDVQSLIALSAANGSFTWKPIRVLEMGVSAKIVILTYDMEEKK